jgi:hypothetical protein
MRSKKAQISVGVVILMVMAIFAALALMGEIFNQQSVMTNQVTQVNKTYTSPASGATVDLDGQEVFGTPVVTNATSGAVISSNYTIDEGISATTGKKTVRLTLTGDTDGTESLVSVPLNVTMTYGAEGYAENSGARSMARMIGLFSALSLVVVVAYMGVKQWLS